MRMTKNKRRILEALALTDDDTMSMYGAPPRSAATVAQIAELSDVANVARTLRNMEADELVTSEVREVDTWCEVPKPGHYPRKLKCYWPVAGLDGVKEGIARYEDGAPERQRAGEAALDALYQPAPQQSPLLGDDIRRDAEGRFSLNDLHRATGAAPENAPFLWMKDETARGLMDELKAQGKEPFSMTNDGPFIARELVFAYAASVSPSFQLQMIRTISGATAPRPAAQALRSAADQLDASARLRAVSEQIVGTGYCPSSN